MAFTADDRSEIAFFDVETTAPTRSGQGSAILEFGAIVVCPRKLVELRSYSTLVRPADQSLISTLSARCNGITKEAVVFAPSFRDIADVVYEILHGRIWAGHNILRFDCVRVREAFAEINRQPPKPKGTIDSLALLTQKFGRRAGDMKMASLATYFGLGRQTHRSLDDVRMNLEVLKYCATVIFLESSLPNIFPENRLVSRDAIIRSQRNGKSPMEPSGQNESMLPLLPPYHKMEENHPILSLMTPEAGEVNLPMTESTTGPDPFAAMGALGDGLDDHHNLHGCDDFLDPGHISASSISVSPVTLYHGFKKIQVLYENSLLQLQYMGLKVLFGVSTKFVDHAGRPRLSFVVDAPLPLCKILDAADSLARELSIKSCSSSKWRSVVSRKQGFYNSPTIRLHLPTVSDGEISQWATEIYERDGSATRRLVFSRFDVAELESLFTPGALLDAYFSLDSYDYLQSTGIRLVAKKLVVQSS